MLRVFWHCFLFLFRNLPGGDRRKGGLWSGAPSSQLESNLHTGKYKYMGPCNTLEARGFFAWTPSAMVGNVFELEQGASICENLIQKHPSVYPLRSSLANKWRRKTQKKETLVPMVTTLDHSIPFHFESSYVALSCHFILVPYGNSLSLCNPTVRHAISHMFSRHSGKCQDLQIRWAKYCTLRKFWVYGPFQNPCFPTFSVSVCG